MSARKRILPLFKDVDRAMKGVARFSPTCKRGCTSCCELLVTVSTAEAEALAEAVLASKNQDEVEALLSELDEQTDFLDRAGDDVEACRDAWWQAHISCALLVDGSCSAYADRPTACRLYYVISDPELCGRREPTETAQLRIDDAAYGALFVSLAVLAQDAKLPAEVGALPEMLAIALRRRLGASQPRSMKGASALR